MKIMFSLLFTACYAVMVDGGVNLFPGSGIDGGGGITCTLSSNEDCSIDSFAEGDQVFIYPGGSTRCALGGNSNPYFFQVQPGQGTDANNLIINFQGGGGCQTADECRRGGFRQSPEAIDGGIFDTSDNQNPFAGWTSVSVLYCTGDFHSGNAVLDPDTSPIYLNGRVNAQAVFDWINANIPNPDRVLITGTSAGSLGAQLWSRPLLSYYKALPSPPVMGVLYDSGGLGMPLSQAEAAEIASLFASCSSDLGLSATEISDCESGLLDVGGIQLATQAANRDIPFGFLNCKADPTGVGNYCDGSDPTCTAADFYGAVKDGLTSYTVSQPDNNVVSYLLNLQAHVLIKNDRFFSGSDGEPTIAEWIEGIAYHDNLGDVVSSCADGGTPEPGLDYTCDSTLTDTYFSRS